MKKKSCDKSGVCIEMFQYADEDTRTLLLRYLNNILSTGHIPETWYDTHFGLLHKGGPAEDPNNWRPIANLQTTYRILARLVYNRIRVGLDIHQSEDQFGSCRKRSCVHALMVMESMISKGIEFNIPVWIISIDLKKAFDRVEHAALFQALFDQQVDLEYIALL